MKINPRIAAAFVFGLFMVAGSFWLSLGKTSAGPESIAAIKTDVGGQPIRGYIPVADNDADGLPDWQNTFDIATVYIDEEPEETLTKTGALAVDLATRSNAVTSGANNVLLDVGSSLTREMMDKDYGMADINVSEDNSITAKKAYGNRVAQIALNNAPPTGTEGELIVLNRALLRDDPTIIAALDPTIASYQKMLTEMLETPVPSSLAKEHLSLINVYQALLNDIKAFRYIFDDALPAMARFRRYQADAEALYTAIVFLYQKLDAEGIQWNEYDPASKLIKVG